MVNPAATPSGTGTGTSGADGTASLPPYLATLDRFEALPAAAELRHRSYALLAAGPGAGVVDVGCGAGRAVAELADAGLRSVGVDANPELVVLARQRFPAIDVRTGTAEELPFDDGALAGYRADKVYHLLPDPPAAAAEAARVLAPGGHAVLLGQDWDLLAIDSDDIPLTRALIHARADSFSSPWAARSSRRLLLDAGFVDVTVEAHTVILTDFGLVEPLLRRMTEAATEAGAVGADGAAAWLADQRRRGDSGRLLVAIPLLLAAGRRP